MSNVLPYNIPLFDLNFSEEEEKAVVDTIKSRWISTGPRCEEFERLFSEMIACKYSVSLSNCTAALHLALEALGISKGDEIIAPSLTFVATINAIKYVHATPVFTDITSYNDLTMNPSHIEKLITPRTRAIIVMHYAGFPCDMERIMAIARNHNLKVIEDACHGPLSEYRGKKLGTIGDIGCFSFFSNKNISTGEGGMLVTDDEEIYIKTKLLRSHGMTTMSYERAGGHATRYDVIDLGYNYRMDDIRASIGIVQLTKQKEDLIRRSEIRKYYIEQLSDVDEIIIPFANHKGYVSNYIFPIVLRDSDFVKRDYIRKKLQEKGIQTSVHYPAVHQFSIYSDIKAELAKTEYIADNEITLPMYSKLTEDQIRYISNQLRDALI